MGPKMTYVIRIFVISILTLYLSVNQTKETLDGKEGAIETKLIAAYSSCCIVVGQKIKTGTRLLEQNNSASTF